MNDRGGVKIVAKLLQRDLAGHDVLNPSEEVGEMLGYRKGVRFNPGVGTHNRCQKGRKRTEMRDSDSVIIQGRVTAIFRLRVKRQVGSSNQ